MEFTRSPYLPLAQDYNQIGKNPILGCLIDQINQDKKLCRSYPDQESLVKAITEDLESGKIFWPNDFDLISMEQWVQRMRNNPKFYSYLVISLEMQKYEALLLDLAAQCLERQINLIPLLPQDNVFKFAPNNDTSQENELDFNLLSCQRLDVRNFFFSIFKKCTI